MWLTILKDMQLQYLLQAMPTFILTEKAPFQFGIIKPPF